MSDSVVSIFTQPANGDSASQGVLIEQNQSSSFRFISGADATLASPQTVSSGLSLLDIKCSVEHCVSDASLMQQQPQSTGIEHGLFVSDVHGAVMAETHAHQHLLELGQKLADHLPQINQGLEGQLNLQQLSQLIHDVQTQLLQLNHASNELFPDLGTNLHDASHAVAVLPNDVLLSSVQADTYSIMDGFNHHDHAAVMGHTTLDALFTHPEAVPLTLDFSDKHHVDQVHDLFSSHNSSSISSDASVHGHDFAGDGSHTGPGGSSKT